MTEKYYFVSYAFFSKRQNGFGNVQIKLPCEIGCMSDIVEINNYLSNNVKDEHGEKVNAVVLNYIKLKRGEKI